MDAANFTAILQQARNGNPTPFNQFFLGLYKNCTSRLWRYTKSAVDSDEVFSKTTLAFWELFVVGGKPLPEENVEGYFYRMCVNSWYHMQRSDGKILLQKEPVEDVVREAGQTDGELFAALKKDERKFAAFNRAVARLCAKCRQLFNEILVEGVKLKEVWEALGYRNYRAIVDAKYHCKKELKKKVLEEMSIEIAAL